MTTVADIAAWMNSLAPLDLSESWDNTGLLLGCPSGRVSRVQTCLTLTPETAQEAISEQANLVVAHHPLPFKPLAKITTKSTVGSILWQLATNEIAIYSPHTAWDSAPRGINVRLANLLGLDDCLPLLPSPKTEFAGLGAGQLGHWTHPKSMDEVVELLSAKVGGCRSRGVVSDRSISSVAIACGSGGSLLDAALRLGCDLFLTGEATFHTCLEAQVAGISLLMIGHYASERFAMEALAEELDDQFSELVCWASQAERDPITTF